MNFKGEEVREGFIVPYESPTGQYSNNIPMDELVKVCQNCSAKHVLLILDCCYSGYALTSDSVRNTTYTATEDYIKDIASRRSFRFL